VLCGRLLPRWQDCGNILEGQEGFFRNSITARIKQGETRAIALKAFDLDIKRL